MKLATLVHASVILALAGASYDVFAEEMADPTRPPPAVMSAEGFEEAVRRAVVQSIIIRPHKRTAIISGERVEVGATYAGARVADIRETEVVLRSGSGTEILKLYPDVQMRIAKDSAQTARKPTRN